MNLAPEKLDEGENLVPKKLGACDVNLVSFGQNLKDAATSSERPLHQRGIGGCGSRMARTAAFAPEVRWRCCRPGRGTILLSQSRTYWHWKDKVLCQGSALVLALALTRSGPGNTALTSIVLVEVT